MEQTGMANLRLKDFYEREGPIMVELGISADTAVVQEGYNLEGFVSFLIDAKDAEQTDGPDIENALTQMIAARAKAEGVEPLDNQFENTFYSNLEKQLILEGRLSDAMKAAPTAAEAGEVKAMLDALRTEFGDKDSGKYLLFAAKALEMGHKSAGTNPKEHFGEVLELILRFHLNQNRKVNKVYQEKLAGKDINSYDFNSLKKALYSASGKKHADENSEFIYKANGISAIRPLTTKASCYLGGEQWCITRTEKKNFFKRYTEGEGKAFVLVKFDGIAPGSPYREIVMQFSGPGEPEFEMWWNYDDRAYAEYDLTKVIQFHIEGMGEDFEPELQDKQLLARGPGHDMSDDLFMDLHNAAFEAVRMNPPVDPIVYITQMADEEAAEFNRTTGDVDLTYEVRMTEESQVGVFFQADLNLEFYDERFEEFLKNKNSSFYSKLRQDLATYMVYQRIGPSLEFKDFYQKEGSIMMEFSISDEFATEQGGGYNIESFISFLDDAKDAEQTDGPDIMKAIGMMVADRAKAEGVEPLDNQFENTFYSNLEKQLLGEEKGRSRQRGIYKFHCMISYNLTTEGEKTRGLDDILADMRALPNVTIVTVAIRNQKIAESRYIAGLAVKFIPSVPGDMNQPEQTKSRIVRDIKRLTNVQSLFKLSAGLTRLE